ASLTRPSLALPAPPRPRSRGRWWEGSLVEGPRAMTSAVTALAEPLLDRWLSDAAHLAPDAGRDLWLAEGSLLLRGWSEPHRRYHTAEHLTETLAAVDELEGAG